MGGGEGGRGSSIEQNNNVTLCVCISMYVNKFFCFVFFSRLKYLQTFY